MPERQAPSQTWPVSRYTQSQPGIARVDPEWTKRDSVRKLSFKTKRLLSFVLLPVLVVSLASIFFDWYLFKGFDKQVSLVVSLAIFAIVSGTSTKEIGQHRDQADLQKYGEIKNRSWQKGPLLVLSIALILFIFFWDEFR